MRFNSKSSLALLAVMTVSWASAQDLAQPVSIQTTGTTVASLLAMLQKETGIMLTTTAATAKDVVFVQVKDVSLGKLLEQLSLTVGAEWSKENGGYRLVRPTALEQRLNAEDRAITMARLRAAITKLVEDNKVNEPFDPAQTLRNRDEIRRELERARQGGGEGRIENLQRFIGRATGPESRTAIKMIQLVPADALAFVRVGERQVFATNPTAMQKGLTPVALQVARQAIQDQLSLLRAQGQGNSSATVRGPRGEQQRQPSLTERLQAAQVGRVYVIVNRPSRLLYTVQIRVTDTSGADLTGGMSTIQLDQAQGLPAPQAWTGTSQEIKLSSVNAELGKFITGRRTLSLANAGSAQSMTAPSAELVEILTSPLVHEPLGTIPGEALAALHQEKQVPTIVMLPDEALDLFGRLMQAGPLKTDSVFAFLQKDLGIKFSEEGGWWIGRPYEWSQSLDTRIDRVTMQGLLTSLSTSMPTIEQLAAYATNAPRARDGGLDTNYAQWVAGPTAAAAFMMAKGINREAYLIYAKLGSGPRQALLSGQAVPLAQAAGIRPDLHTLVFFSPDGPQRRQANRNNGREEMQVRGLQVFQQALSASEVPMIFAQGGMMAFGGGGDERTDFLPGGVPQEGQLRMQSNRQRSIRLKSSKTGATMVVDVNAYAWMRAAAESGRLAGQRGMQDITQFDLFQEVSQTTITITLEMNPPSSISRLIADVQPVANSQFGSFESLSADLRNQFQRQYEEAINNQIRNAGRQQDRGNRRTPPPRP